MNRIGPVLFLLAIVVVASLVDVGEPKPALSTPGDVITAHPNRPINLTLVDERYEDGSALLGATWLHPETCPDPADPCRYLVIIPAWDSPDDALTVDQRP